MTRRTRSCARRAGGIDVDHPNVLAILLFGSPFFEPAEELVPADYTRAMERWRAELEDHRARGMTPWIDTIVESRR